MVGITPRSEEEDDDDTVMLSATHNSQFTQSLMLFVRFDVTSPYASKLTPSYPLVTNPIWLSIHSPPNTLLRLRPPRVSPLTRPICTRKTERQM